MNINNQILFNGSDWSWTETIEGKGPGEGYSLDLILKYKNNPALILHGSAENTSFKFEYSAEESALLPAGDYAFQFKHFKTGYVSIQEFGSAQIKSLLSSAADTRNQWERIADELRNTIERLAAKEVTETTYNNRTYKFNDIAFLRKELVHAVKMSGKAPKKRRIVERYL